MNETGSNICTVGGYLEAPSGQRVVVLCNLTDDRIPLGNVLIVPPYGRSAKDMFFFAYYLWRRGFNVIRFDARNHVGASTGEIANFTLSSLEKDLDLVYQYLLGCGFDRPILLGVSLSTPVVLKYVANSNRAASIVSVVGALDVKHAIECATGESVTHYRTRAPNRAEFQSILGYQVRAQQFVDDMDEAGYGSLDMMLNYIKSATCPVHMIAASDDDWVMPETVVRCHQVAPLGSVLSTFENITHEFGRSVSTAKQISLEICRLCSLVSDQGDLPWNVVPNFAEILRANSVESNSIDGLVEKRLTLFSLNHDGASQ